MWADNRALPRHVGSEGTNELWRGRIRSVHDVQQLQRSAELLIAVYVPVVGPGAVDALVEVKGRQCCRVVGVSKIQHDEAAEEIADVGDAIGDEHIVDAVSEAGVVVDPVARYRRLRRFGDISTMTPREPLRCRWSVPGMPGLGRGTGCVRPASSNGRSHRRSADQ